MAHEHLGGDIQRQLLGGAIEPDLTGLPAVDSPRDRRVHRVEVRDQPLAFERVLHDPAVVVMLLEVHQHHAAMEERSDEEVPPLLIGERAIAVGEHRADALGTQHADDAAARPSTPRDRAVELVAGPRLTDRIRQKAEHLPDDRQPGLAHHRLQAAPRRRRGQWLRARRGQRLDHTSDGVARAQDQRCRVGPRSPAATEAVRDFEAAMTFTASAPKLGRRAGGCGGRSSQTLRQTRNQRPLGR